MSDVSEPLRLTLDEALVRLKVARDDAAELGEALADVLRVIGRHDDRGPHILPSDVWDSARAALARH